MVSARWAQTLLDAATPGPWRMDLHRERDAIHIDAPRGDERIGHDAWEGLAVVYGCEDDRRAGDAAAHGNASLICAAHDLAQTVVALHAEVDRAASSERGRIVAWLRAWADAYEPKYSVYPDDCRDLADRIERGEVTP